MEWAEPGRVLSGRYRLDTVVGRGGMGVVWRARDELLERDVAVKELVWPSHFTDAEQQTACRRAVREAQMAGRLAHHNVVRIYDILEEDGHPWIIMELLPYQSLRDLLRAEGPLTPAAAARVGLGVLAALDAAHAEGVLHRDVKPANILVGSDGRVVLTDFGIARSVGSPTLTAAGTLVGSPSYIAPERARGGQSSPAGDLWGLGACLYTAVEGHPPFERNGALATLTAVVVDEPDEAVHAGPLWPVISGLLAKEPDERLDAGETERMLREVTDDGEALRAAPASRSGPAIAAPADLPSTLEQDAAGTDVTEASARESSAEEPAIAGSSEATEADADVTAAPAVPSVSGNTPAPTGPGLASPSNLAGSSSPGLAEALTPVPATVPPSGGAPFSAVSPATADSRHPRRSRRPAFAVAALAAVAGVVTAVALVLTSAPGRPAASSASPTLGASATGSRPAGNRTSASASASSSPAPASGPARTAVSAPAPSGSGSPDGGSAGYGALAAGYYRFTNSTGFSIGVPDGWQISHVGHYVYITDPSNSGIFLLIDQSDIPNPNPLADWKQQAANRASTYPDYHLIRLGSVSYPQAEKAADWEFTYVRNGVLVHILNRNVLANAHHAYALYWSTPESDWDADYHYFQDFAGTFRPAP